MAFFASLSHRQDWTFIGKQNGGAIQDYDGVFVNAR